MGQYLPIRRPASDLTTITEKQKSIEETCETKNFEYKSSVVVECENGIVASALQDIQDRLASIADKLKKQSLLFPTCQDEDKDISPPDNPGTGISSSAHPIVELAECLKSSLREARELIQNVSCAGRHCLGSDGTTCDRTEKCTKSKFTERLPLAETCQGQEVRISDDIHIRKLANEQNEGLQERNLENVNIRNGSNSGITNTEQETQIRNEQRNSAFEVPQIFSQKPFNGVQEIPKKTKHSDKPSECFLSQTVEKEGKHKKVTQVKEGRQELDIDDKICSYSPSQITKLVNKPEELLKLNVKDKEQEPETGLEVFPAIYHKICNEFHTNYKSSTNTKEDNEQEELLKLINTTRPMAQNKLKRSKVEHWLFNSFETIPEEEEEEQEDEEWKTKDDGFDDVDDNGSSAASDVIFGSSNLQVESDDFDLIDLDDDPDYYEVVMMMSHESLVVQN